MNDIAQSPELEALAKMTQALRILDEAAVPGEIGGHLDLAIARLEERLGLDERSPAFEEGLFETVGAIN